MHDNKVQRPDQGGIQLILMLEIETKFPSTDVVVFTSSSAAPRTKSWTDMDGPSQESSALTGSGSAASSRSYLEFPHESDDGFAGNALT